MAYATPEAIRDRIYTLLEAITPAILATNKPRRYRNEGGGDFQAWAELNPASAFRRFQVRYTGADESPEVSNTDFDDRRLTIRVLLAYPHNARTGPAQAMDRDDTIESDWRLIERAIGIYGRSNFSSTHDATPLGATCERIPGAACDFLEVTAQFRYYLEAP